MGWAVPPPRPVAGQASAEYVALLAVVCAVVAGAAAVGSVPPIAAQVAGAVRHGICRVAGAICTPGEARAAGLAPCLVHARADRERLGGRVLVVKLRRGDALLVERRSDGSAAVSFADGGTPGASAGSACSSLGRGANARIGAGLRFTAGRTWEFATVAAAARFVRRWGKTETLTGEARGLWPGGDHPPPPDSSYKEGGAYGELAAALGGPAGVRAERGARPAPCSAGASRAAAASPGTPHRRRDRRAARARARRARAERRGRRGPRGHVRPRPRGRVARARRRARALRARAGRTRERARRSRQRLRGAEPQAGGHGRRLEAEVALDLTDPANRRALLGVLEVMRLRAPPADWDDRVRALAHRLDADGAVDVRLLRVGLEESELGAEAALGLGVGGSYERTEEVRDLLRAWSLRAGGSLQEREDCIPA